MFSYEQRKKAVRLFLKYRSITAVVNELGYPSVNALKKWVKDFNETHSIPKERKRRPKKYSKEQVRKAINYYLTHGKNQSLTRKVLGYPNKYYLRLWLNKYCPQEIRASASYKFTNIKEETKREAVIDLCSRNCPAKEVARKYNVSRPLLYNWKQKMLGNKQYKRREKNLESTDTSLLKDVQRLRQEEQKLKEQIYRLQLERDALEAAANVIKKDQGINPEKLSNKEKVIAIDTQRNKYALKELLAVFKLSKSSYFYQKKAISKPDKYLKLRELITKSFNETNKVYGYRRIRYELLANGMRVSEKVIKRLMKEENLVVKFKKQRKYCSYIGEISPAVENIVNRNFHSEKPNQLWLTDITEFTIPAGKVYLSPIIDCFDGLPVAWTIGTNPNAELVNRMLKIGIDSLKEN